MNSVLKRARHTIGWFIPRPVQSGILRRLLKRRGIITEFPMTISTDVVGEYPVEVGCVEIGKNVRIGRHTYFSQGVVWRDAVIGRYCSISYNVLIGAPQHQISHLSTHPNFDRTPEGADGLTTVIGNDVWIAGDVVIRRGTRIGDGAIVGAGAVVLKDVPPYSIVAGVPAKVIRYRFGEEVIRRLLELKWWDFDDETLMALPVDDVERCIDILERRRTG